MKIKLSKASIKKIDKALRYAALAGRELSKLPERTYEELRDHTIQNKGIAPSSHIREYIEAILAFKHSKETIE